MIQILVKAARKARVLHRLRFTTTTIKYWDKCQQVSGSSHGEGLNRDQIAAGSLETGAREMPVVEDLSGVGGALGGSLLLSLLAFQDPKLEVFKTHARQLNPRLEPFLTERIGITQVRRYTMLVKSKIKHFNTITKGKCPSGSYCFAQGGEATMLPTFTSGVNAEVIFNVCQTINNDSDYKGPFADRILMSASFPPDIPPPPAKSLPARFECPLCFKVESFLEPSDWTEHVHKDTQVFICTFPDCAETNSFERKEDWLRHEDEWHRPLERWQCNLPGCNHRSYRQSHFVQHLVGEHQKRDPTITKRRRWWSSTANPILSHEKQSLAASWQRKRTPDEEIQELWDLVELCYVKTKKVPEDEACRFCGLVCHSWMRLSNHLARHMEQIVLPVLELLKSEKVPRKSEELEV